MLVMDNISAREKRIEIWKKVLEDFKGKPRVESKIYDGFNMEEYNNLPKKYEKIDVEIIQKDCIYAAIDNYRLGMKPLLLNMASEVRAGGGVRSGSSAQEEELFRRSNYFLHLHQGYYPLSELMAIVSRGVIFYRLDAKDNYNLMKFPTKIDCIAAAAIRHPLVTVNGDRFKRKEDAELCKEKIRMLFYSAYKEGNDCVVLSAWGCGAFGGPTEHIAKIFKQIVQENEGRFKKIVFAIYDDYNYNRFKSNF
jgi:uncharacterized protein (TIGR02452 family)